MVSSPLPTLFRKIISFSNRQALICLLMAILPIAIRVSALRFVSFPSPSIHDEFSYLLAADTFASGRLTNPPHPMWVHFETFDEIFQPTYASTDPPGQGLFMAFGQRFLGHPWFGVCLSFGLMCGCLCWMLQGFLPPVYALLGTLVAMGEFSLFGYWMDSYCGAAIGAMGGSLVLGAVPRLAKNTSASALWLASLGLMILALSRPFEGLVVTFVAVAGLLWWRHRLGHRLLDLFAAQVLVPCVLTCIAGVSWLLYYNYRVTGNALLTPSTVHERTYVASPIFYLLPAPPEPIYRHEIIRKNWTGGEKLSYLGARHNPLGIVLAFWDIVPFLTSTLTFLPAVVGLFAFSRSPKMRVTIGALAALWAAMLLTKSWHPNYYAPGAGLLLIPTMYSFRWLRVRGRRAGEAAILLFVVCCFFRGLLSDSIHEYKTRAPTQQDEATNRVNAVSHKGDRHLVIVRYAVDHDPLHEFVFNRADIDGSFIIWARDMGDAKNRELINYYPDRRVWLLEPDSPRLKVTPYPKQPLADARGSIESLTLRKGSRN
jgi:hypothetical protein